MNNGEAYGTSTTSYAVELRTILFKEGGNAPNLGAEPLSHNEPPWDGSSSKPRTNKDSNHKEETAKEGAEAELITQQPLIKTGDQATLMNVHRPATEEPKGMKDDFGILTLRPSCLGPRKLLFIIENSQKLVVKVTQSTSNQKQNRSELLTCADQHTLRALARTRPLTYGTTKGKFGISTLGSFCQDT